MRGEYVVINKETGAVEVVVPNSLVGEGHAQLLDCLFNKNDLTDWDFIFGVFAEVPAYADTAQAQYTSEPTIGVNGYARQTVAPSSWTIVSDGETKYAESPDITFTATGGAFDAIFNRFFMHLYVEDPAATFTSYLTSFSSALPAAVTLDTASYVFRYRMFLR